MKFFLLLCCLFYCSLQAESDTSQSHYMFMIYQGKDQEAWEKYLQQYEITQKHDFALLRKMALALLDYGFKEKDAESQVLTMFGAGFSADEETLYILEEGMQNKVPQIQLIALQGLGKMQNEKADRAIFQALSSPFLALRYEALNILCEKKHPQAINQIESLMCKTRQQFLEIYPSLIAQIDSPRSTQLLRKSMNAPSPEARLSTISSIAKYKREDLLPQIRQLIAQAHHKEQEAAAYAVGKMKDEISIKNLEQLSLSKYPSVALSSYMALYQLGDRNAEKWIEKKASEGNLEAIAALGKIGGESLILSKLMEHSDLQIRMNALIASIKQGKLPSLDQLRMLLIDNQEKWGFLQQTSPGKSLKYWKVITGAPLFFKEHPSRQTSHVALKIFLLQKIRQISPPLLMTLAHEIFQKKQNDLVPVTAALLESIGTESAIDCLKKHQQQLGAPLVRNYCQLALFRLKEEGPWNQGLKNWIRDKNKTDLIRFRPPEKSEKNHFYNPLTPEETTAFFIQAIQTVVENRKDEGIALLVEIIASGNKKNRYALAGLLIRAVE